MTETIHPHGDKVRTIIWTLLLMMASFVGGAFVGLHPNWLPSWVPAGGTPAVVPPADATSTNDLASKPDTTQPSTAPSFNLPQTMPSAQ
jgi:hypothetical protein